jgi:hypothetical protein
MNKTQAAAYVNSQVACALIEMQGMVAANVQASKNHRGYEHFVLPFDQSHFNALINHYGISHNAVLTVMGDTHD